jgi:hypothetical protein
MYDTAVVRENPVLGGHSLCSRFQRNKLNLNFVMLPLCNDETKSTKMPKRIGFRPPNGHLKTEIEPTSETSPF